MVPLEQACHLQSWVSSLLAFWEKFVSSLPFDFQHKVKGSCYFPWAMQDVHLRTQEQIHFKGWPGRGEMASPTHGISGILCIHSTNLFWDPTMWSFSVPLSIPPSPRQSILCQSPSANNVLLPLFFKPLKWFLSFSFPTNCIFPVESLSWYNQQTNCSSRSPGPMLADPCTSYAFQPPLFCN